MQPSQVGPYTVEREIGRGGMGVVYLGRDTRLGRMVAIKALPEELAQDADRLARFEREARTLASLNHPGVAAIYGLEESQGRRYLVLEFVEGETLDAVLKRGPMPVREAVRAAVAIAGALEAAHEKGIVHRDLKPRNIIITPDGAPKVLDFGLARQAEGAASGTALGADSPTLTSPAAVHSPTIPGVILGTAGYMSPEQARGKPVDKRSDVFSFGCILYEMLTGGRAFSGETLAEVLGATLHTNPDLALLPPDTPTSVRRVLSRCLAKEKRDRWHDIADARIELESVDRESASAPETVKGRPWLVGAALFAGLALGAAGVWAVNRQPAAPLPGAKRFGIGGFEFPVGAFQSMAISPNGEALVFRAQDEGGVSALFVRRLDELGMKPLAGSESGRTPFFSPDGRQVGFLSSGEFTSGEIRVASLESTEYRTICRSVGGFTGAAWLADDAIVFGQTDGCLYEVPSDGGEVRRLPISGLDGVDLLSLPSALPHTRAVLCGVRYGGRSDIAVYERASGNIRVIAEDGHQPFYIPTGHVIFQRSYDGPLMAVPFDAERLTTTGRPFAVLSQSALRAGYQSQSFGVASDGTLVFVPPGTRGGAVELVRLSPSGEAESLLSLDRVADSPRLSPDGDRVAYRVVAPNCDLWVLDMRTGVATRVTHDGDNHGSVWAPDGFHLMTFTQFSGSGERVELGAPGSVRVIRVDGVGEPRALTGLVEPTGFLSCSGPDGSLLVLSVLRAETGSDVVLFDSGRGESRVLLGSRFNERGPVLSPDGSRLAFASDESGVSEVYVQPYPSMNSRVQVSIGGGWQPVWSRDGKRLYFRRGRSIFGAAFADGPGDAPGRPVEVATNVPFSASNVGSTAVYDVDDEGRILLFRDPEHDLSAVAIEVVVNWFSEIRRLDPNARKD